VKKNRLILGDGWLGTELVKETGWDNISRKKDGIEFTDIDSYKYYLSGYDEIINCIACTNTYDKNKDANWNTNYKAVVDLVDYLNTPPGTSVKLIQFSTDYVYAKSKKNASEDDVPVHDANWYTYTKILMEAYIELRLDKYLILRATHKPRPFMFDKGLINQVGNFDYIDTVVKIYSDLIKGDAQGFYNVGTELKTMYDLAKESRDDVVPTNEKFHPTQPLDISMNLDKLKKWRQK